MASDVAGQIEEQSKKITDLLASIKKELDADAERHAQLQTAAAAAGEVLQESQNGVTIDLSKSNIRSLPVKAIELMRDRVERLAVSHNPQISIPSEIVQCERLRYLNIRWNALTDFPNAVLQLSKLEILDLSRNKLTSIPEGIKRLTSLKFLAVARNRISRLPLALGEMSSLGKLKFDENPLEFPPPESYKLSTEYYSAHETERDKEICQKVKRFLRAAAVKQKLRAFSEEDLSEDHVETPRPPKRSVTAGRFPIRPSMSGIENMVDSKVEPPSEIIAPPPVPQKSHARVESNASSTLRRPGIAPLPTSDTDASRSRSETVTSSVSLRQRRQGFVPVRKPAGDLASVTEDSNRTKQAAINGPTHRRGTSSVSTVSSTVAPNSADTSGTASPMPGRPGQFRKQNSYSDTRNLRAKSYPAYRVSGRIVETLTHLTSLANSVILALTDGAPHTSNIGKKFFAVQGHVYDLGSAMGNVVIGTGAKHLTESQVSLRLTNQAVVALRSYGVLLAELNLRSTKCVRRTEGYKLRPFLIHMHAALIELRNALPFLGVKVLECSPPEGRARVARPWSSKSITPTQPKLPTSRQVPRPPMLQGVGNNAMPRSMQIHPVTIRPDLSRTNTMTALASVGTMPSVETYATGPTSNPLLLRTNTWRSFADDSEGDVEFDRIFHKLQAACGAAAQALPQCRMEFQSRKELAQSNEQRNLAQQWAVLINKSDEVIANNKALRKRLDAVRVVDPGLRHQRDFWHLCDAFVLSWTEFATDVKELSQQRIDINSIKHLMRTVQRHVKDVSKMIFHSALYQNALPSRITATDPSIPSNGASPNLSGWNTPNDMPRSHYGYLTSPTPAMPHAVVSGPGSGPGPTPGPGMYAAAATPVSATAPRDYFPEPPTARRYDTPMQHQQQQQQQLYSRRQ